MKRWMFLIAMLGAGLLPLALTACKDASQAAGSETPGGAPAIPPVAVEVARPTAATIAQQLDVTGTLAARVEADVRAEVPGLIAEVFVNDWVAVKKGDVLARLDTRDLQLERTTQAARIQQAEARLQKSEAALQTMQRDAARMDELFKQGVISAKEHDGSGNDRRQAAADLALNKAALATERATLDQINLRLSKAEIRAPIGGVVSMRRANPGLSVGGSPMEDPLFKIVDLAHLELRLMIPMSALAQVEIGQPVTFVTDALPGREFKATIRYLNPAADSSTRSIQAAAEVDDPSGTLRTGLFARAAIHLGAGRQVLEIPLQAAQLADRAAQTAVVFVVAGGKAARRTIQIGDVGDRTIQVFSGLAPQDQVITRGAYQLRDGDPIRVTAAEATAEAEKGK